MEEFALPYFISGILFLVSRKFILLIDSGPIISDSRLIDFPGKLKELVFHVPFN